MLRSYFHCLLFSCWLLIVLATVLVAQTPATKINPENLQAAPGNRAVVVDDRLSALRPTPGFAGAPLRRIGSGRVVFVTGAKRIDGVIFYKVRVSKTTTGWLQSEAVVSTVRRGDDLRLLRMLEVSTVSERMERARVFLDMFAASRLRPAVLLILGDAAEEIAARLTKSARRRLDEREMKASGAPRDSFFLNFKELDRYRRMGIGFRFEPETAAYHYDGSAWREILRRYGRSPEADAARARIGAR